VDARGARERGALRHARVHREQLPRREAEATCHATELVAGLDEVPHLRFPFPLRRRRK
jgi:hypothetical protein